MSMTKMKAPARGAYRMSAKGDRGEIYLYDVIGGGWFGGVTAKQFAADLKALGAVKTIDLRVNSEGGDVFEGRTIYTLLNQHTARIVVHIDGLAASIASIIAMAGDDIRIAAGGFMMIHRASTMTWGNAAAHQRQMELLQTVDDTLIATYVARTGQEEKQVRRWMDDETWMNSTEAVERGFADSEAEPLKVAASVRDPSRYRRVPAALIARPGRDALAARIASAR